MGPYPDKSPIAGGAAVVAVLLGILIGARFDAVLPVAFVMAIVASPFVWLQIYIYQRSVPRSLAGFVHSVLGPPATVFDLVPREGANTREQHTRHDRREHNSR